MSDKELPIVVVQDFIYKPVDKVYNILTGLTFTTKKNIAGLDNMYEDENRTKWEWDIVHMRLQLSLEKAIPNKLISCVCQDTQTTIDFEFHALTDSITLLTFRAYDFKDSGGICLHHIMENKRNLFDIVVKDLKCNQSTFIPFEVHKRHYDKTILASQVYMEQNYTEKLTIHFLSKKYAMSTRNFQRRFKKATNVTVCKYIQKLRVESAKKLLESSSMQINEVMHKVGYNDPKTFRKIFKRNAGIPPIAYRKKYNLFKNTWS